MGAKMAMNEPDGPMNVNHWQDESDDRRHKRDKYWQTLGKIAKSLNGRESEIDVYMLEHYGIKMIRDEFGLIATEYEVVDQEKYLIFVLKYL
jgi:hypothetical protein